jgi:hypothetical protein
MRNLVRKLAIVALSTVACILLMPPHVFAQRLDVQTPPAERPRGRVQPRPPVHDLYPDRPPVPHAPAFLPPFAKQTETGRAGVAAWTAPNRPVGSQGAADPESAGWLGFGFALEWGRPANQGRPN